MSLQAAVAGTVLGHGFPTWVPDMGNAPFRFPL
jgi:hypothetical protein